MIPRFDFDGLIKHNHGGDAFGGNWLNPTLIQLGLAFSLPNTATQGLDIDAFNSQIFLEPFLDSPITGNKNDYNPHGVAGTPFCYTQLGCTAPRNITGADSSWIAGPRTVGGAIIIFSNISASTSYFVFKHKNAGSAAGNQFDCGGSDIYVGPGQTVAFLYDSTDQIWVAFIVPTALQFTWTPVLQFQTAGTSTWANTTQLGFGTVIGNRFFYEYFIQTTPTNGTATGNLQLAGFPIAAVNLANEFGGGTCSFQGYTKAGYTAVNDRVGSAGSTIHTFTAMGSGVTIATLAVGDIPTGQPVIVRGAGHYAIG